MGLFARIRGRNSPADSGVGPGALGSAEMTVLVVNVETTGLSPVAGAAIHWCASVALTGDQVRSRDVWALSVHQDRAVFGAAPSSVERLALSVAATRLAGAMAAADIVVAHNAAFEQAFIAALLCEDGVDMPPTPWLDTMLLAKAAHPDWPSFRLAACAAQLGIQPPVAHDATAEAAATADVFMRLRQQLPGPTVTELLEVAGLGAPASPAARATAPADGYRVVTDADRGFETSIDVRPVRGGMGIFISFEDDPVFDTRLSPEDRSALLDARIAERTVCAQHRLKDIPDPLHRAAHEAWTGVRFGDDEPARDAALRQLVAASCPNASEAWASSVSSATGGTRGEFNAGLRALRVFKEEGFARDEDIRRVGADLLRVNNIKAGPKLLLAAWQELGPWLAAYAPCELCAEVGRSGCRDLDLAYQAAQAMEWNANSGDMERVGAFLVAPDDAKPHLAGTAAAYVALMDALLTVSPSGYARLACAVAEAAEKSHPDVATDLYYANVRAGQAERYEFDRLSLLLERAKRFDDAVEVAELGLAHPDCGATRGERLRKRVERCRAKASAPVRPSGDAPIEVGELEALVCSTCGTEFTRVRTRGRKPTHCPDCRR